MGLMMTSIRNKIERLYSFKHKPPSIEIWNILFVYGIASILSYDIMRAKEKMSKQGEN